MTASIICDYLDILVVLGSCRFRVVLLTILPPVEGFLLRILHVAFPFCGTSACYYRDAGIPSAGFGVRLENSKSAGFRGRL